MTEAFQSIQQVRIAEAARLLGYSQATIYAMLQRGDLRSVGQRKMRRIPLSEIQKWQRGEIEQNEVERLKKIGGVN